MELRSNEQEHMQMSTLETLQSYAAQARDLELQIKDLEAQLHEKRDRLKAIYHTTMPDLLDALHLDHIGLPANGNQPGLDFHLQPYYSANIAAAWDEERKQIGFDLLTKLKADDLIKTEVAVRLPKGQLKLAKKICQTIEKLGPTPSFKQSVHPGTLSAWLRELYEIRHQSLPQSDLDLIGGFVGRKVTSQERMS